MVDNKLILLQNYFHIKYGEAMSIVIRYQRLETLGLWFGFLTFNILLRLKLDFVRYA